MLKKAIVCLSLAAALCLAGASLLDAQGFPADERAQKMQDNAPRDRSLPTVRPVAPRMAGNRAPDNIPAAIVYDDGVVTAVPGVSGFSYGNQFNSGSGMSVKSFSVTMVSAFIVTGAGTDNVFVSLFGPVAGTAAPVLFSASVPLNNGSGAFNTFTFGPYAGGGSFQAGIWYIAGDSVGLGAGTNAGQGHHGMLINDIAGTGFSPLPGLNALVSANTAFLIPVELTGFSISDE